VRSRTLDWPGCVNARDLGGLPAEDGAVTRFGQVVRADSVRAYVLAAGASGAAVDAVRARLRDA
jgi:hypothetical protein